jgi:hypothetical protein
MGIIWIVEYIIIWNLRNKFNVKQIRHPRNAVAVKSSSTPVWFCIPKKQKLLVYIHENYETGEYIIIGIWFDICRSFTCTYKESGSRRIYQVIQFTTYNKYCFMAQVIEKKSTVCTEKMMGGRNPGACHNASQQINKLFFTFDKWPIFVFSAIELGPLLKQMKGQ